MSRWIGFFIAVIIGIAAGLYYGWLVDPVEYVDTTPDSLLIDYKADYVLMVAEAFALEGDLELAARRIALLDDQPPLEIVRTAIVFAARAGYVDTDLAKMRALETNLQAWVSPIMQEAP